MPPALHPVCMECQVRDSTSRMVLPANSVRERQRMLPESQTSASAGRSDTFREWEWSGIDQAHLVVPPAEYLLAESLIT